MSWELLSTRMPSKGVRPFVWRGLLLSFLIIIGSLRSLYSTPHKTGPEKSDLGGEAMAAKRAFSPNIYLGLFCLALILATCLINPASSLARFVPQMWLFPIIAVLLGYSLKDKLFRILGHLVLIVLIMNNILIGYTYYSYNLKITRVYNQRLENLAALSQEKPIQFYSGHFLSSSILRFDRFGIVYSIAGKKEECSNGQRILPSSIIMKCEPK